MIKLDVLDCCHECDMFSSLEVKGSDKCVSPFGKIVPPDVYIRCRNQEHCAHLLEYLETTLKENKMVDTDYVKW